MSGTLPGGAYGFALDGVASRFLGPADARAPRLTVERARVEGDPGRTVYEPDRAALRLVGGGRLELLRRERLARFLTREPLGDDELVHPYLAPAASVFAGWEGRQAFHAAAFAVGDRALAVLGAKELGKSTLVAALALEGVPVLADDVLVLADGVAQPGPRCVDLRPPSAAALAGRTELDPARDGERFRLALPPAAPARLAGVVFLAWGEPALEPLPPAERLRRLALQHSARASTRPEALLDLARLPAWELRRAPDWGTLRETALRVADLAA